MTRSWFYALVALLAACGAAVSVGKLDSDVNLESARAVWSDVLRDADEVGLHATRVSAAREMELGDRIAQQVQGWGQENAQQEQYITAVGASLAPNLQRKEIHYRFHVIESPEINAFAIPGGHVYVLTGLLHFLNDEAELAAILGHEMSHVDLRHCISRYQYQMAAERAGLPEAGELAQFAHSLVAVGYSQDQELEADASGVSLAIDAGYDPDAAARVFRRMQQQFGEGSRQPAATPAGEVAGAVVGALGSYFRTHPPSADRARHLEEMVARNHRELAGRDFYRGVSNYQKRIPRSQADFEAESHVY